MKMSLRSFIGVATALACLCAARPGECGPRVETAHLLVDDVRQQLSAADLQQFAERAESAFVKALGFWAVTELKGGKIILELHREHAGRAFSVFQQEATKGERRSYVRVYGVSSPQEMVHKMTHALFPTEDKLIRNMMGIPTEARFGNPRSFPMCGYDPDAWVAAIRRDGSYIPLGGLGEAHEDWGMSFQGKLPVVADRKRQHASYAEAGSFGNFLVNRYGVGTVKAFYRAARQEKRPWQEAFGRDMPALEAEWLASLDAGAKSRAGQVDFLASLWKQDPANACTKADEAAARK